MDDQIQKLELKITELENKLKELSASHGSASAIDPEELKTYQKVHAQLSPIICNCIQCYHCYVCLVCRVCHVCINECTCGPCACTQFSPTQSGGAGFSGFMK